MAKSRRDQVKESIKKIRQFYALGRKVPARGHHRDAYGQGIIEAQAERLGQSPEAVRQARQFVETYSEEELDELLEMIEDMQINAEPDKAIFGKTQIIRLMSIRKKGQRAALQRRAIEEGWSAATLESEIAKQFGTRRHGGRRRRVPPDMAGMLTQIEMMCEEWRRWEKEVARSREEVGDEHLVLDDLSRQRGYRPVRRLIEEAGEVLGRLHEAVLSKLDTLQPGRERRALRPEAEERPAPGRRRTGR